MALPGMSAYCGSKFALEGIGESLAQQLAPLGIRVTNVEPGPFRTDWAGRSATYVPTQIPDYAETVGKGLQASEERSGNQAGDPRRAAEAMYELVRLEKPPVHLLLGGPAHQMARAALAAWRQEIEDFAYLGEPTDFPA